MSHDAFVNFCLEILPGITAWKKVQGSGGWTCKVSPMGESQQGFSFRHLSAG